MSKVSNTENNGEFVHIPVLFNECMDALNIKPDGIYVDCTAGGGGHSSGILSRLSEEGRLISFDKDDEALEACRQKSQLPEFAGKHWDLVKTDFGSIADVLRDMNIEKVDGILADLGVSSHQIDTPERGFSYAVEGPLDMRMDETSPLSARVVVNTYGEADLTRIFRLYGEERFSGRIAAGIVRDRQKEPFESTLQLASKIASYMPAKARNEDQHPARRCFQAIRIEVNHELEAVEKLLHDGPRLLKEEGRMAVISFHSLEDRIVKEGFKILESPCICPRDLPMCVCGRNPLGKVMTRKPIEAGKEEVKNNTRAHCCKLRVFERNDEGEIWN